MIDANVVGEVQNLLAAGEMSQRAIARILGISRGTVDAIAAGKRPDYEAIRRSRQENETGDEPIGPPMRCPTCGGLVYMPCRLCAVRRSTSNTIRQSLRNIGKNDEPFGLNLRPEHEKRYQEIRRSREMATKVDARG
jgi:transcriptional regulator with XRE-family HTH domain